MILYSKFVSGFELHTQILFIKQNPFSPHSLVWLHGFPIWHCAGISGVDVGGEKQLQMPFQQMPIPQPPHCSSLEHVAMSQKWNHTS